MLHGILYTIAESCNCYKVCLLEALLGLKLEQRELDFSVDAGLSPEFLRANPRAQFPCLVDGDKVLCDSSSILVWLAGKYGPEGSDGPSSFWSSDLYEQAQIVDWLAFSNSWVQYGVAINRGIVSYDGPYTGLGSSQNWSRQALDTMLHEGTIRGNKSLDILQKHLTDREWLVLGRPTIADISVFPYIALAPMGDISLQPYPAVIAWIERVKKLPGFISFPGLEDPMFRRKHS